MRGIILFGLVFLMPAYAGNLPGAVFAYECKQVKPIETGFKCMIEDGIMRIHFVTDTKNMGDEEKEYVNYRYNALLIRYIDLGGKRFYRTSEHWAGKQTCWQDDNKKHERYAIYCPN